MSDMATEDRGRVEAMAAYGIPHPEIARVLRLELEVLRRDYGEELATGRTKANSRVAEALYRTAIAGGREGVIAAIFWLKARAGWKETTVQELALADGVAPRREELRVVFVEADMSRTRALIENDERHTEALRQEADERRRVG